MSTIAIFIDGGYFGKLCTQHFGIGGGSASVNYRKFVEWIRGSSEILNTYYYVRLGLDLGSLVSTGTVDEVAIVAGDSDFIPPVEFARQEGVVVLLTHGPQGTYHQDLWRAADDRKEITQGVIDNCIL